MRDIQLFILTFFFFFFVPQNLLPEHVQDIEDPNHPSLEEDKTNKAVQSRVRYDLILSIRKSFLQIF